MSYNFLKKVLFILPPEASHTITMKALQLAYTLKLHNLFPKKIYKPVTVMGLYFDNPIGLAAGLDKNGDYIDALAMLGFGFLEIGTITPRPQPGNPKPRLFRLVEDHALINRMGFNNKGSEHLLKNLQKIKYKGVLGINIGKNFDTPNEKAVEDYLFLFKKFSPFASYITINISSPNTKNLRDLQSKDPLTDLVKTLKTEQKNYFETHGKYVPLAVKISPDLDDEELETVCKVLLEENIDAIIATNTTIDRENLKDSKYSNEIGGLSGRPLADMSTQLIEIIRIHTRNQIPIVGSGGAMNANVVKRKMECGAALVQLYTGLIYSGPQLIQEALNNL